MFESKKRQLFVFWQFNGNNTAWCELKCPQCYGGKKEMKHYWNGDVEGWERGFEKLDHDHGDTGLFFVESYGESMSSRGFYETVEMIGRHPTWTLNIVTNYYNNPERLLQSRLAKEKRLFINACWHPEGVPDKVQDWENFKRHCLMTKASGVPLHVLYCWFPPNTHLFPMYFKWLDANCIRVTVRRFIGKKGGIKLPFFRGPVGGEKYPSWMSEAEKGFLYSQVCAKVKKYGLNLVESKGMACIAGRDLILVKSNGDVGLCADFEDYPDLGNVLQGTVKLRDGLIRCPSRLCGGDYGMLHLVDSDFGELPKRLANDTFVSQVEGLPNGVCPVPYPNRAEMLKWLELIEREK